MVIIGKKYGKLTAIELDHIDAQRGKFWKFQCDCGKIVVKLGSYIVNGGAIACNASCSWGYKNLVGKKFGRLTVIGLDHKEQVYNKKSQKKGLRKYWLCVCECGKNTVSATRNLEGGMVKSCGCGVLLKHQKGEVGFNDLYQRYSQSQKRRFNQKFDISKEDFRKLTSQPCHYCGIEPKQKSITKNEYATYYYNGLDRIDSDKPYVLSNVVSCCKICNIMKQEMSQKEFLDHVAKINSFQRNKI